MMSTPPVSPLTSAFSPVKVADSPSQVQRGNLTGTPRKVKDSVADIFNLVQKWNNLHADGSKLLRKIADDIPTGEEPDEEENYLHDRLQKKCLLMVEIKDKMAEIVDNLKTIYSHFLSLQKLEQLNRNHDPVFLTWPMSMYVELSEQVYRCYRQQLSMNIYVVENIALGTRKNRPGLVALWLHQPYLDPFQNFRIDAALKETGFT